MKSILKITIPAILICSLCYLLRGGKNILEGIYILFPIIYILIGILYIKKEYIITLTLTTIVFIICINIWFNMGTCLDLALIYILISYTSKFIRNKLRR